MIRLWVFLLLLLSAPAAAQTVVIATTGTFPPYLFEEGARPTGFDIDLMDEICRRRGFECEYRIFPLIPGLEAVARGEADIALGGLGITAEREAYGRFTCPYRGGRLATIPILALDRTVSPEAARIAVLGDSLTHRALSEQGYTAIPFEDLESAIRAVLSGQTDAFAGNTGTLDLVDGAAQQLVVIGSVDSSSNGAGFLVAASDVWLLSTLNDSIHTLNLDGTLLELSDKWFGAGRFSPPDSVNCIFVSAEAATSH